LTVLGTVPNPTYEGIVGSTENSEIGADLAGAVSRETVKACVDCFADRLRSIVLTGSLARSEGSFLKAPTGWQLLGDAEYVIVLDHIEGVDRKSEVSRLKRQIENALAERGLSCSVSLAIGDEGFFRSLKPHIFAYELRKHGKAVFGQTAVLGCIPQFSAADIPLEDGWRLLANRLVEQLETLAASEARSAKLSDGLLYRTVKLYLDMATSFLLFSGKYEASYRGRSEQLRLLSAVARTEPTPFDVQQFASQVAACTAWKLSPRSESEPGPGWTFWRSSHHYASRLWNWELSHLMGTGSAARSDTLILPSGRNQAITAKLRGWAYVVREAGWRETRKRWPNWLASAASSPRYRVYSAAAALYSLMPAILSGECEQAETVARIRTIQTWLPIADSESNGDWRSLARAIACNYHRFLENTRA
jgi:hypothetical protein